MSANTKLPSENNNITYMELPSEIKKYEISTWLSAPTLIKMDFLICKQIDNVINDWKKLNDSLIVLISQEIQDFINGNVLSSTIHNDEINMACNCYRHKVRLLHLYSKYLGIDYQYDNIIIDIPILNSILYNTITYEGNIDSIVDDQNYLINGGAIIKTIRQKEFYGKNIKSVIIPPCVRSIGCYSFANNKIHTVYITNSTAFIYAFAFDKNIIKYITIPQTYKSIMRILFDRNILSANIKYV